MTPLRFAHRSWRLFLLALTAGIFLPDAGYASDAKTPYQLRLVVSVGRHRLLTDVFREQVARELGDGLQAALGDLGRVEVTDKHPMLADIRRKGLERGLVNMNERSHTKTHFVLIDYSDGLYEIQARQFDGLLSLPGPVVRHDRTRDRALVARVAGLLVEHDLGLLGTVASEPEGPLAKVRVDLKGGALGAPLDRWIKKGEVFGLVQVSSAGAGTPVPYAVLQVTDPPKDGACVCRLFHRYKLSRATGLRCVKLGTGRYPVRLRLVQEMPGGSRVPLETSSVSVQIRRNSFEGENTSLLSETPDGTGDVDTSKHGDAGRFEHLAFVSLVSGEVVRARVPLALVDDQLRVVPVPSTASEGGELLSFRVMALRVAVSDSYQVLVYLFEQINKFKPEERSRAIERVRKTLERSQEDYHTLSAERAALATEIAKLPAKDRPSLAAVDQRLQLIQAGVADLRKHIDELEKIEREENDPKRRKWLEDIERAKLLEKEAELGQAIKIYQQVKAEGFKSEDLDKHLDELTKLWEPKGEQHQQARDFIYNVWPGLSTEQLKDRLKEAQDALAECRKVGDKISPVRLQRATQKHVARLEKEVELLRPDVNPEDERMAQIIKEVVLGLQKLDSAR